MIGCVIVIAGWIDRFLGIFHGVIISFLYHEDYNSWREKKTQNNIV